MGYNCVQYVSNELTPLIESGRDNPGGLSLPSIEVKGINPAMARIQSFLKVQAIIAVAWVLSRALEWYVQS